MATGGSVSSRESLHVAVTHISKDHTEALINRSGFDKNPHDVSVLVVVLHITAISFGERREWVRLQNRSSVTALRIKLLMNIGDESRKNLRLVIEVAVEAAGR